MTGYGKAQLDHELLQVTVEIKTLNSKYLDISLRQPRELNEREIEIKSLLQKELERGKININIDLERKKAPQIALDEGLVQAFYLQLSGMAEKLQAPGQDIFRLAVQFADNASGRSSLQALAEEEWQLIRQAIVEALANCNSFRLQEGQVLKESFVSYIQQIEALLVQIEAQDPRRIAAVKERLRSRLQDIAHDEKFDQNRFEQEMIYFIEKLDISEEKVRLRKHLRYFLEMLHSESSNGKKLGFVAQEIGREINTIGSKANDADIQRLVIEMKEELEKIKEQSLNIL
jgi:uncharacterized protein (TIGR00255 family)